MKKIYNLGFMIWMMKIISEKSEKIIKILKELNIDEISPKNLLTYSIHLKKLHRLK